MQFVSILKNDLWLNALKYVQQFIDFATNIIYFNANHNFG